MLHKSSTYCPRQMSSSSLIFSIGVISMKVNPVFISILIITTLLTIHTLVHSYLAIILALGHYIIGLLSWPSHLLRCLRLLSWCDMNLGSFHGPHTFSLRCLRPSSWGDLYLGSYHDPNTFHLTCIRPSSCDGLNLSSYYGSHTFCLRCLRPSSWVNLYLGSYHGPHTFFPRCLSSLLWGGHILFHRGLLQWL